MLLINSVVKRRSSLEELEVEIKGEISNTDELLKVAQVLSDACDDEHESNVAVMTAGMESYSSYRVSLESAMIAAAVAAAIAVLGLIYKLYKYFTQKKGSDVCLRAVEAVDEAEKGGEEAFVQKFDNAGTDDLLKSNMIPYLQNASKVTAPFEGFASKWDFGKSLDMFSDAVDDTARKKVEDGALDETLTNWLSNSSFAADWAKGNEELKAVCDKLRVRYDSIDETAERKWLFKITSKMTINSTIQTSAAYNSLVEFCNGAADKAHVKAVDLYRLVVVNTGTKYIENVEAQCKEFEEMAGALEKKVEKTISEFEKVKDNKDLTLSARDSSALSGFLDYIKNVNGVYRSMNTMHIRIVSFILAAAKAKKGQAQGA